MAGLDHNRGHRDHGNAVGVEVLYGRVVRRIPGTAESHEKAGVDQDLIHRLLLAAKMLTKQALGVARHIARPLVAADKSLGGRGRSDGRRLLFEEPPQSSLHGFTLRETRASAVVGELLQPPALQNACRCSRLVTVLPSTVRTAVMRVESAASKLSTADPANVRVTAAGSNVSLTSGPVVR